MIEPKNNEPVQQYPKVKVREQEQDGPSTLQDDSHSLLLLKVFQSLSVHGPYSPVKENRDDSLQSVAKIPKAYVPNLAMPSHSVSKGTSKNSKIIGEDTTSNVRASSVPRPRAVLSSPDNDRMIRNRNKLTSKRPSTLKKSSVEQNSPAQAKVIPGRVQAESPLSRLRKGYREASDNKSGLKQRKSLETAVVRHKASLGKGNPE